MVTLKQVFEKLRAFALRYPETREDHPWGESAFKVKGKIFVIANVTKDGLHVTVKLPRSRDSRRRELFPSMRTRCRTTPGA